MKPINIMGTITGRFEYDYNFFPVVTIRIRIFHRLNPVTIPVSGEVENRTQRNNPITAAINRAASTYGVLQ